MDFNQMDDIAKIEFLLRKICFDIKQKGRTILGDYKITPPQFNALQILANHDNLTISELSNKLYLAPSTITDLVDRMENNGLVERVRTKEDRRTVRIHVLDKGYEIINKVIEERCRYINTLLEETSEEDKKIFIKYLEYFYNDIST